MFCGDTMAGLEKEGEFLDVEGLEEIFTEKEDIFCVGVKWPC